MFLGELLQGGSKSVGTFVHGVAFPLACFFLSFLGANPAQAVSTGCLAVRGGALNITDIGGIPPVGVDLVPTFTGNFEAGETVTWTFGGNPAVQQIQINAGANLPVVGGIATFTFPTTGPFDIDESIAENAGVTATLTATCNETTAEKQDAVKNAVKTLTEMQLTQSLIFQQQLLQELTGTFLTGALPAILLETLERTLAVLQERSSELNRAYSRAFSLYRTTGNKLQELNHQSGQFTQRMNVLRRLISSNKIRQDPVLIRRGQLQDVIATVEEQIGALRAEIARIMKEADQPGQDQTRAKSLKNQAYNLTRVELKRIILHKVALERRLALEQREVDRTQSQIIQFQSEFAALEKRLVPLEQDRKRLNIIYTSAPTELEELRSQIASVVSRISHFSDQIMVLKARIGQSAAPFAGVNLQGAMGLTGEASSNPHTLNPLGLKGAGGGMSFFTDLNTLRRQAHQEARLQQAPGSVGPQVLTEAGTANILNPAYNIWAKGDFSEFESDQTGADREGQAYSFATGAYVAPNPRFMFGTMYRFRDAESESTAQNSDVETSGHGIGVYSTLVLTPKLSLSGQALYERSDNDITRGAATGSFDADQYVASGQLQGSFWRGPFWLRPTVGVTWAHVDSESFTDSTGTRIPGQTTEQGQLTFGPSVGFRLWREGKRIKFIEPSFTATGVWTFKDEGDTTLASGTIIEQDDVAAQFSAGLSMLLRNNVQLSFNGGYSGLGDSEVESWSAGGQISIPFGGR